MLRHTHRRLLTFLIAVLAWAWVPAPAFAQVAERDRPFKETFGLVVKFSQGQPLNQLSMLDDLGVRWVRDAVLWADMEPSAGKFNDFPASFKMRLAYYREHKIGLVFVLAFANGKAYPATKDDPFAPIDPKAFGRYAAHVSALLKKSGVEFVIQVWNEPHNFIIAKMVGGQWNGKPPSPWVKHYVDMVREVVGQVKALDPKIKVIDCEDVWVAHYWFLEEGLPKQLDGFGIHPYSGHTSMGPEVAAAYEKTDWALPFQLVDRDRSFQSAIRRLREQGVKKLGKTPEVWITEWGWAIGEKTPSGPVDEYMLAAFLPRSFIASAAAGVEVLCWFSSQDSVDGLMGLIANDGTKRAAFKSYRTMSAEVGNLVLDKQLAGAGQTTQGVQAYLFTGGGQRKVVLWSADNKPRVFKLDGKWAVKKAVDMLGNDISLKNAKSLSLGLEPIYLSLSGTDSPSWSDDLVQ